MKAFTGRDLLDFLQQCSDQELDQPVGLYSPTRQQGRVVLTHQAVITRLARSSMSGLVFTMTPKEKK